MCNNCYRLRKRTVLHGEHKVFPSGTFFNQLLRLLVFNRFLFLFLNNWFVVSVRISSYGCTQIARTVCEKRKNCSRQDNKIKRICHTSCAWKTSTPWCRWIFSHRWVKFLLVLPFLLFWQVFKDFLPHQNIFRGFCLLMKRSVLHVLYLHEYKIMGLRYMVKSSAFSWLVKLVANQDWRKPHL